MSEKRIFIISVAAIFFVFLIAITIVIASSFTVTDTFNDESKIVLKTNLIVSGGQVKLVCQGVGCSCTKGSDCSSDTYCRASDQTCQSVPVCQVKIDYTYGTVNVVDNTQVPGCNSTCQACQSGSCSIASSGTDPGSQCDAFNCGTGTCNGYSAQCDYYTSGNGTCSTCKTCNGATSASCVDVAYNTQAPGCNGTCQSCRFGYCGAADSYTDPGDQCPSPGYFSDASIGCATGYCQGGIAQCGYYDNSWSGNCPTCKTCAGATSVACVNVPNNNTAPGCGNYSWEICQACQNGSCGYADAYTDPGYWCDIGWGNNTGCATGYCKGGSGECGYYTYGHGSCDICDYCEGATSVSCVNMPQDSKDQGGCYFCDGWGNNESCSWGWPWTETIRGQPGWWSIECKPSTSGSVGYMTSEAYQPGYSCGSFASSYSWTWYDNTVWATQCSCY